MAENFIIGFYQGVTYLFDPLHYFWEKDATQRKVAGALAVVFLAALALIELKRIGLLPAALAGYVPCSLYMAINLAFTLVLIIEVISPIFTLPCSISKSVGKKFEILTLILLRNSGFALATLLIHMALTAFTYWSALIGIGAAFYAVLLTIVYNNYVGGLIRGDSGS
jgi:hypothetical protein